MPGARIYVVIYGLAMPAPRPVLGVNFAFSQVDRVRSDPGRIKVSTICRLLSLSFAANSRRILPRFSYKYATGVHRLKEQCWWFHFAEHLNLNSLDSYISILVIETYSKDVRGMTNIKRGSLAFPCRVPVYMWLYMVWLCRHHDPFAASILHLHKLIAWGQIVAESKFPPFVACCRFPVLQIRVVSCPGSPVNMQR